LQPITPKKYGQNILKLKTLRLGGPGTLFFQ
jgi:hypothetical protein